MIAFSTRSISHTARVEAPFTRTQARLRTGVGGGGGGEGHTQKLVHLR
jgi:hypothetical protein